MKVTFERMLGKCPEELQYSGVSEILYPNSKKNNTHGLFWQIRFWDAEEKLLSADWSISDVKSEEFSVCSFKLEE